MYQEQSDLVLPDGDAVIWRYLSLPKYASMLAQKALFFARADRLGDEFEGSFPRRNLAVTDAALLQGFAHFGENAHPVANMVAATLSASRRKATECVALNCWHVSEHD
jgi:hypothetical protein